MHCFIVSVDEIRHGLESKIKRRKKVLEKNGFKISKAKSEVLKFRYKN